MISWLISQIVQMFMKPQNLQQQMQLGAQTSNLSNMADGDSSSIDVQGLQLEVPEKFRMFNPKNLYPLMRQGQPLNFDLWLSYLDEDEFWRQDDFGEPVWSIGEYELYFATDESTNRQLNMTLPLTEDGYQDIYKQNKTLFMHF